MSDEFIIHPKPENKPTYTPEYGSTTPMRFHVSAIGSLEALILDVQAVNKANNNTNT